jgi:hypothetical protein
VSSRSTVLLGYIPVPKLANFSQAKQSDAEAQIFHDCMHAMLEPLVNAGEKGTEMVCSDGFIRKIYPIVAAYVADHPEQRLVCCTMDKRCPKGLAKYAELGRPLACKLRDPDITLHAIEEAARGRLTAEFTDQGLRCINPFWRDLPHCNIFECLMPDLLHQLHKGVFGEHVSTWVRKCISGGKGKVD